MAIMPPEIRDWSIYKITSPSNRVYIGLTSNEPLRQKNYKKLECKQQRIIYYSLKKYGWDAHNYEVIDTFSGTWDYAYNKEMYWVRSHMSNVNKYPEQQGMNLNDGGAGNLGYTMSTATKEKISKINLGRKWSEESKIRFSEQKKGFNSYWPNEETKRKMGLASKGRKMPEYVKKRLSEIATGRVSPNKGKPMSEAQKYKYFKAVLVYDLDGSFIKECSSVLETVKEFKVSKGTVRGVATGLIKTPEKFIFKYK